MGRASGLLLDGSRRAAQNLVAIMGGSAFPSRAAVLRAYLPMLARESLGLARPSRLHRPGEARLFGHTVRYADFRNLVFNFEEVFVEQQYAFRARSETPRVLDCGANIGLSVLYLKLLYPAARITAFEPSPEAFPLLEANVASFEGVTLEQKALAGSASELTIFGVPGERASLRATTVEQAGTEALAAVEAVPLSRYLEEPVDLLKLDVEGRELEILHELVATGTIAQVDRMLVEAHHHESLDGNRLSTLLGLLEDNGYAYRVRARGVDAWGDSTQDVLLSAWRTASTRTSSR